MIARLAGRLAEVGPGYAVVMTGGIGWRVQLAARSLGRLPPVGQEVELRTRLLVREDDVTLVGFLEPAEAELFDLLIGVTGVGPRGALAVLSVAEPDALVRAIAEEDVAFLTRAEGIGRKLASRVVLELKDRLKGRLPEAGGSARAPSGPVPVAQQALEALGLSAREAEEALAGLDPGLPVEDLVRAALRRHGARREEEA